MAARKMQLIIDTCKSAGGVRASEERNRDRAA